MKVQCPTCKEFGEMVDFTTCEEGLYFRCESCHAKNFVANPHLKEPAPLPVSVSNLAAQSAKDEIVCPKCGHSQKDKTACHRCGLDFEKFDPAKLLPDPQPAVELWNQIQQNPMDQKLHDLFLGKCIELDRIDYASRQLRILSRHPHTKEIAEQMQARLFNRVQAKVAPAIFSPLPREDPKRVGRILFWIVMAVTGALFAYYIFHVSDKLNHFTAP